MKRRVLVVLGAPFVCGALGVVLARFICLLAGLDGEPGAFAMVGAITAGAGLCVAGAREIP